MSAVSTGIVMESLMLFSLGSHPRASAVQHYLLRSRQWGSMWTAMAFQTTMSAVSTGIVMESLMLFRLNVR
jgi:hypothetical protein